jgi:hypothetical protein
MAKLRAGSTETGMQGHVLRHCTSIAVQNTDGITATIRGCSSWQRLRIGRVGVAEVVEDRTGRRLAPLRKVCATAAAEDDPCFATHAQTSCAHGSQFDTADPSRSSVVLTPRLGCRSVCHHAL